MKLVVGVYKMIISKVGYLGSWPMNLEGLIPEGMTNAENIKCSPGISPQGEGESGDS